MRNKWFSKNLKRIVIVLEEETNLLPEKFLVITSKGRKALTGYCSIRNGKKSMTVSHISIAAEILGEIFKNLGEKGHKASKKMAKNNFKIREELWNLEQTLGVHLCPETVKRFYHHYLK